MLAVEPYFYFAYKNLLSNQQKMSANINFEYSNDALCYLRLRETSFLPQVCHY